MHKFRTFSAKAGAAALAAAMIFPMTAFAEPMEELDEIFKAQSEVQEQQKQKSFSEDFLGLSELGKAMGENGFQVQASGKLLDSTLDFLGLREILGGDSQMTFDFRNDPKLQKWLLGFGAGITEEARLDVSLYGDKDRLALSLPQLFSGALSLHAGSLKEQYANAPIANIIGEMPEEFPDIDMSFYPDKALLDSWSDPIGQQQENILAGAQELGDKVSVEKTEKGEVSVYTVIVNTEDIAAFYASYMDSYVELLSQFGAMGLEGEEFDAALEESLQQMSDSLEESLGEALFVDIIVKDGLVQSYHFETEIYPGSLEGYAEEVPYTDAYEETAPYEENEAAVPETEDHETEALYTDGMDDAVMEEESEVNVAAAEDAELAEDMEFQITEDTEFTESMESQMPELYEQDTDFAADYDVNYDTDEIDPEFSVDVETDFAGFSVGQIICDFSYEDPSDLSKGYRCNFTVNADDIMTSVFYNVASMTDGKERTYMGTYNVAQSGYGVNQMIVMPFAATLNAETGELDAKASVNTGGNSMEMKLDSTFAPVEKGRSFVWTIDELSLSSQGETLGVSAEVSVAADAGEFEAPTEERVVLEMTEDELAALVTEIMTNTNKWAVQFMPEDASQESLAGDATEDIEDFGA